MSFSPVYPFDCFPLCFESERPLGVWLCSCTDEMNETLGDVTQVWPVLCDLLSSRPILVRDIQHGVNRVQRSSPSSLKAVCSGIKTLQFSLL